MSEHVDVRREATAIIRSIVQREQDRSGKSESWVRKNRALLVRRTIESGEIAMMYADLNEDQYDMLVQTLEERLI